jgi:uncharacterized Zn ribbon protein
MRKYKIKICNRCGKEYVPTGAKQKYCRECRKNNYIPHPIRTRICNRCKKEYMPTSSVQKYCEECRIVVEKEIVRKYHFSEKGKEVMRVINRKFSCSKIGKEHRREYCRSEKGREIDRSNKAKRRGFDYIPLNKWKLGYIGHHIDVKHVIYIPEAVHKSIYHDVIRGTNMHIINGLAIEYIKN